MTRYKTPSIRDEGLTSYLNSTRTKHKGFGYDEFVTLVQSKVNVSNLARAMGVTRPTIESWLTIYREEQTVVASRSE